MNPSIGKPLFQSTLVHHSAVSLLPQALQDAAEDAMELIPEAAREHVTAFRLSHDGTTVTALSYPSFWENPFPELAASWKVSLETEEVKFRTFTDSLNPPILFQKEQLLPPEHPQYAAFRKLSQATEKLGLFKEPLRNGFRQSWQRMLRAQGYRLEKGKWVSIPVASEPPPLEDDVAPSQLSLPFQILQRFGFLEGDFTCFDYGCGDGADLEELQRLGVAAEGWDPTARPDAPLREADIVNLGYVLNTIEDHEVRTEALKTAYALSQELLVVSVHLFNQNVSGEPFRDGLLLEDHSFQKYYTPQLLSDLIEEQLGEESVAVAPGVFFVFKDKGLQQRFLLERSRSYTSLARLIQQFTRTPGAVSASIPAQLVPLLQLSWELGREPHPDEVPELQDALNEAFGSFRKALKVLSEHQPPGLFDAAAALRRNDLKVYLALELFKKRRPYHELDPGLQRDVKHFFKSYTQAQQEAKDLLFQIGDNALLSETCAEVETRGLGWMDDDSLQLHSSLVEQLPPLLRVYVGCASHLVGDVSSADLVKIHLRSGKLSLMRFDDFFEQAQPKMLERVKVDLRKQEVQLFDYSSPYEPPYLYLKSRFMNEEMPEYGEQLEFEEQLEALGLFDFSGYGPNVSVFDNRLHQARWELQGRHLIRSTTLPDLDAPCGENFRYRDFLECGPAQEHEVNNVPTHPDTYTALYDLATTLLDPIIDYFGEILLTFGFCSASLAKQLSGTQPKTDQHIGHESNRVGNPVCARGGIAVDFLVEDEDMLEVAQWIVEERLPFDRLVLFGSDRPLHLSHGPQHAGDIQIASSGTPQALTSEALLELDSL